MINLESLTKSQFFHLILNLALLVILFIIPFDNQIHTTQLSNSLYTAIQGQFNSYFYLTSAGKFLASDYGIRVLLLFSICSTFLLFSRIFSESFKTLFSVLASWVLLLEIFEIDYSVLAIICFSTLFLLSLFSLKEFKSSTASLFAILTLTSWLCLLNFALISLLLGLLFVLIAADKVEKDNAYTLPLASKLLIFSCFFCLYLANTVSPSLPWPDYPSNARLTQLFDAPAWYARPLIGADNPLPVLDRLNVREHLRLPFLVCLTGFLILIPSSVSLKTKLALATGIILTFCDIRLPETFSQIMPLQGIARLIPGISDFALAPVLTACILFLISVLIINKIRYGFIFIIALYITFYIYPQNQPVECNIQYQSSPSCEVSKHFSDAALELASSEYKKYKPARDSFELNSFSGQIAADSLVDKDPKSRWSSGTGKQTGNEWLELKFNGQKSAIGLELQVGDYLTDFPRGLKILAGNSCEKSDLKIIYEKNNWQGSVLFTEKGLPYFSAQADVRIFFDQNQQFSCLRIEQTGLSDNFDWSVAEFRLLTRIIN